MKVQVVKLILLAGLIIGLSGCTFQGVDDLFELPRTSETYEKLQETVQSVIGTATGISPISGNNTQTLQLVDLDQDGKQEAVAFFKDGSKERPLKIAIFKQDENGNYNSYAQIEGAGTDIESIEYKNLVGGQELEILVSWQVSSTVHTLAAYNVQENQTDELMRSAFTRYMTTDLNGDDRAELLLIQFDSANQMVNRVELFVDVGGVLELHSSAALSEGIVSLQLWEAGFISGKVPSLLVTSKFNENEYITDIFCLTETGLRNITLNESKRISTSTLHHFISVLPEDINGDGIMEIPIPTSFPSYHNTGGAENFWNITWMQYDKNGLATPVLSTYHNNGDHWYLDLPEQWAGVVTLSRPENAALGERPVTFSYWTGDPAVAPQPFLTIYRLNGNNRDGHAKQDERFTLWADSETIFAAEFYKDSWNCGLDKTTLLERFHPI